jgi:ElaB/YqjD/DUF883 family membrane-anchored ribosome-binding protein
VPAPAVDAAPRGYNDSRRFGFVTGVPCDVGARVSFSPEPTMSYTREKLVDDFSEMLTEAEDLMKRAANETGDRAKDLRTQVEAKLLAAKLRLQELQGDAVDQAKAAARVTDDYVHDNPWQAIGVAAAVGFVVGLMMNRR